MKLNILVATLTVASGSYLPVRRAHRLRLVSNQAKIIPDPHSTLPNLDELQNTISEWNSTLPATTDPGYTNPVLGGDLDASIQEIQNRASQDVARLTGSLSSNHLVIDAIRANITKFADETRRNISRINSLIGDISDYSTSTLAGNAETIQAQLQNIQAEVDMLAGNTSASASIPSQIKEIDNSIASLEQRVSALEKTDSVQTQVLAADTTSSVDNTGMDFLLYSWTGRIALAGAVLGVLAVILSSVALSKIPSPVPVSEESKQAEQVLLEAGGEQPADQEQELDPNDPNAQQYYSEQEGEGTAQEQQ